MLKYFAVMVLVTISASAQTTTDVLTNETVIKMIQAGVPSATIINTITAADKVNFRFIGPDLQRLMDARVPDEVFKAMAARDKKGDRVSASTSPSQVQPSAPVAMNAPAARLPEPKASGKDRQWKIGRVLDSTHSQATFQTGATTSTSSISSGTANTSGSISGYPGGASVSATTAANGQTNQTSTTVVQHVTIRDTELVIMGDEYAYIIDDPVTVHGPLLAKALANRKHGCRFVIAEDIKYAQDKAKLWVLDADGKECKLDIVRQERIR